MMFGAQLGKTESGNNWIGYTIHHSPGPMLAVQPTVEMAKRNSKQRVDPLIEETPALKLLVKDSRSKDAGNTILQKDFPGGTLVMTGANSAVGLRSMAAGKIFLDEVDAYPGDVDGEGDPVDLATARSRTFSRRKILLTSTPTVYGRSKIEAIYEQSDRRRYHVPCPRCGFPQILVFANLRWEKGQPNTAHFECIECHKEFFNREKTAMLAAGRWVPNPGEQFDGKTAGFHLASFYSPVGWFSWADIADLWEKAGSDDSKRKTVINTVFAETWRDRAEAPEWTVLYQRREDRDDYKVGLVPPGALFLTAAADVQADRIEVEIRGWGRNRESWSIAYIVLQRFKPGPEGKQVPCRTNEPELWNDLDSLINADWPCAGGGTMPIWCMGIDTGYNASHVYDFCLRHPQPSHGPAGSRVVSFRTVVPIKGGHSSTKLIEGISDVDAAKKRGGLRIVTIGVNVAKQIVFDSLWKEPGENSTGVIHFPLEYQREYFKGLCSEERLAKKDGSVEFRKKPGERNESLDTAGYNTAMAELCGASRFTDEHWGELESRREAAANPVALPQAPAPQQRYAPVTRTVRGRFAL